MAEGFKRLLYALHERDDATAISIAGDLLCLTLRTIGASVGDPELLAVEFALLAQRLDTTEVGP